MGNAHIISSNQIIVQPHPEIGAINFKHALWTFKQQLSLKNSGAL